MKVNGVYIFNRSGVNLFSRKMFDIQDDLITGFITAIRSFFNTFSVGGLVTFSSEQYIFYLASEESVTTALIVNKQDKSDNYFNLAHEISKNFYNRYRKQIDYNLFHFPDIDHYDLVIEKIIQYSEELFKRQQKLIKLYEFSGIEKLTTFDFESESQLFKKGLFVAVNNVTKQIFIIQNIEANLSKRIIYLTNKAASALNQKEFKSVYKLKIISDILEFETLIIEISKILKSESIPLAEKYL